VYYILGGIGDALGDRRSWRSRLPCGGLEISLLGSLVFCRFICLDLSHHALPYSSPLVAWFGHLLATWLNPTISPVFASILIGKFIGSLVCPQICSIHHLIDLQSGSIASC
jgi:hypothetical protein